MKLRNPATYRAEILGRIETTPASFKTTYLSVGEVAERHGVPYRYMLNLVATGRVFPVAKVNRLWGISPNYQIFARLPKPGELRGRGRPPGSRNLRPYPKGVKRPRVKSQQE